MSRPTSMLPRKRPLPPPLLPALATTPSLASAFEMPPSPKPRRKPVPTDRTFDTSALSRPLSPLSASFSDPASLLSSSDESTIGPGALSPFRAPSPVTSSRTSLDSPPTSPHPPSAYKHQYHYQKQQQQPLSPTMPHTPRFLSKSRPSPRSPTQLRSPSTKPPSPFLLTPSPRTTPLPFYPHLPLTPSALLAASTLPLHPQSGPPVPFLSLFANQPTIVLFLRHFHCPLCQDYMLYLCRQAALPAALAAAGVQLAIITPGSPKMIASYRKVFKCPYPVYTDPSRRLYEALGMTLRTLDGGPDSEKGEYVEHGQFGGLVMAIKHAIQMPLAHGGDIKQLGGEFVLGPGLQCSYSHRMTTTRSHAPLQSVLSSAGVSLAPEDDEREDSPVIDVGPISSPQPPVFPDYLARFYEEEDKMEPYEVRQSEEDAFLALRARELARMEARKRRRRLVCAEREKERGRVSAVLKALAAEESDVGCGLWGIEEEGEEPPVAHAHNAHDGGEVVWMDGPVERSESRRSCTTASEYAMRGTSGETARSSLRGLAF